MFPGAYNKEQLPSQSRVDAQDLLERCRKEVIPARSSNSRITGKQPKHHPQQKKQLQIDEPDSTEMLRMVTALMRNPSASPGQSPGHSPDSRASAWPGPQLAIQGLTQVASEEAQPGCLRVDPKKGNLDALQAEIAAAMQPRKGQGKQSIKGEAEETEEEDGEQSSKGEGKEAVLRRPAASRKRPSACPHEGSKAKSSRGAFYSFEWTRSQIMCRTGIPGKGQTTAFKFKTDAERKVAEKKAQSWVDLENRKRASK